MDPTTAIVQFIGIVLFSASVPGDPGLHAIMPRIGHVHQSELHTLPPPEAPENLTRIGSFGVENHIGAIIYRSSDRLYENGGWKSDGVLDNGWNFLVLNGERVRFLTNGGNGEPQVPADLPRTGAARSCQVNPQSLNADFLPPYHGAVGVIDIPEGQLTSCMTTTINTSKRRDTRLAIETNGVLVITATKKFEQPKALVLKGNAVVFVANIPPYALVKDTDLKIGEDHWIAYNAMLTESCSSPPKVDEMFLQATVPACDSESLGESYIRAKKEPPLELAMIDSGCSNSQWP